CGGLRLRQSRLPKAERLRRVRASNARRPIRKRLRRTPFLSPNDRKIRERRCPSDFCAFRLPIRSWPEIRQLRDADRRSNLSDKFRIQSSNSVRVLHYSQYFSSKMIRLYIFENASLNSGNEM